MKREKKTLGREGGKNMEKNISGGGPPELSGAGSREWMS